MSYAGSCFCGAVKLEVTGSPEAMGYCHCNSCRSWSGGPVNAFSLWKTDAVQIKSGAGVPRREASACTGGGFSHISKPRLSCRGFVFVSMLHPGVDIAEPPSAG